MLVRAIWILNRRQSCLEDRKGPENQVQQKMISSFHRLNILSVVLNNYTDVPRLKQRHHENQRALAIKVAIFQVHRKHARHREDQRALKIKAAIFSVHRNIARRREDQRALKIQVAIFSVHRNKARAQLIQDVLLKSCMGIQLPRPKEGHLAAKEPANLDLNLRVQQVIATAASAQGIVLRNYCTEMPR